MSLHAPKDAEERAHLLLLSIADVAPPGHPQSLSLAEASDEHRKLFRRYIADLEDSVGEAEAWWTGLVERAMQRNRKSRDRAERDAFAEAPVGPASHGRVLATVRKFWLECAALNAANRTARAVPPEMLVLGWLIDEQNSLYRTLAFLTYLPIGLDEQGRWI
jgi:hypothetical protein